MMKPILIIDLDNCISDDRDRIPLIDWTKTNPTERYAAYHDKCDEDDYCPPSFYLNLEEFEVAIFTARPEAVRKKTASWLEKNGVQWSWLFMRPHGNEMSSVELKEWTLKNFVRGFSRPQIISYAIDDRKDIVEMYRANGISGAFQLKIHDVDAFREGAKVIETKLQEGLSGELEQLITHLEPITPEYLAKRIAQEHLGAATLRSITGLSGKTGDIFIMDEPSTEPTTASKPKNAADLLAEMADTYRQRNAVYGSNYEMVGPIMAILFPNGAPKELLRNDSFHLFELVIVKLSRLAISGLTHTDSAHDAAVYCAMIESIIHQQKEK